MRKIILLVIILSVCTSLPGLVLAFPQSSAWNKTEAIKELPFCALILRTLVRESRSSRDVDILMEPDQVTESNLILLFKVVSEKYPTPLSLEVDVSTDVEQLRSLVLGMNISGPWKEESERVDSEGAVPLQKKGEKYQWAYYKRMEHVELFRYNPNFPDLGMKTVILRGKE